MKSILIENRLNMRYQFITIILLGFLVSAQGVIRARNVRNIVGGNTPRGVSAPLLGDEIDLETIDGIEQVTKLVLIKTDSLPEESNERIDGRYLNSLMETLYTGLRKPFKSVSADILGIFPSFEEIQVRCERPSSLRERMEKDEFIHIRRSVNKRNTTFSSNPRDDPEVSSIEDSVKSDSKKNDTSNQENDSNDLHPTAYKSSLQVCRAVTDDCLSTDNLVQILPPSITTFDKALVRLCPIMLFRIMNHLCHKSGNSFNNRHQEEIDSVSQVGKITESLGHDSTKDPISLNTLLRETQMLKNLQSSDDMSSKKPQKLHKKLKTQTTYKTNGRLNTVNLQQHGSVDEQLLKIRLKLTEPSIEKVWIFSLLFVILSIVVSMGGLIVLPFVKKTTRRRILTLFEGLAVGGLAGSATLHMFPQAFGLVDENYHKYFWRIFVVFFGIYICYLCERIIKILKVMRSRMRRRSRASLADVGFCYGFSSVNREISRGHESRSSRVQDHEYALESVSQPYSRRRSSRLSNYEIDFDSNCKDCLQSRYLNNDNISRYQDLDDLGYSKNRRIPKGIDTRLRSGREAKHEMFNNQHRANLYDPLSQNDPADINSIYRDIEQSNITRQRLVQCLKSVQRQFSPVYAVQTQSLEGPAQAQDKPRGGRLMRLARYREKSRSKTKNEKSQANPRQNRLQESPSGFARPLKEKTSKKKHVKQRDVETMLYHQRMMGRHGRGEASLDQGYLQQRLSSLNDVAAERQDQDNPARMSVDTVAWMIVFGDAVLNVIDGLSIGAAFERNILAGISISVAVMLEEVTHRLGTFAVLIRAGMSMQQSLLCTFLSACALFPGLIVGILLSDATEDATPYIFCAAGGIFLYMALVDVMKEMNRSIENAIRKDIKSTLQIFALQNIGIVLAVIFLSFLALYEQAMDFEEYQMQYQNQPS